MTEARREDRASPFAGIVLAAALGLAAWLLFGLWLL
jgi:hypothetical protein